MRRKDRAIGTREELDAIIQGSRICHLAFASDNEPYVVPISFGYDGSALYFHTAQSGRKIDFIAANDKVCFTLLREFQLVTDPELACNWTFSYESVVGTGRIEELTQKSDKIAGLNRIMLQYSGKEWEFDESVLARTRIWRLPIDSLTGKRSVMKKT